MVEWLREVGMPADFINKLSRMFQDIKVIIRQLHTIDFSHHLP